MIMLSVLRQGTLVSWLPRLRRLPLSRRAARPRQLSVVLTANTLVGTTSPLRRTPHRR